MFVPNVRGLPSKLSFLMLDLHEIRQKCQPHVYEVVMHIQHDSITSKGLATQDMDHGALAKI